MTLGAIAGHDPKDRYTWKSPVPDYIKLLNDDIKGLRVGIVKEQVYPDYVDQQIRNAVLTAADVIKDQGASVKEVSLPGITNDRRIATPIIYLEGSAIHQQYVRERIREYDHNMRITLLAGSLIPAQTTDKAIAMAYRGARPTDTEKAVGDAMSYNVMRFGADIVAFNIVASGQRLTSGHHMGAPVPLEPGTLMRCDFGGNFRGYYSDLARMAVIGKPSQRQKDAYSRYFEVHQRTLDYVKPGVTGEDIFNFACSAYRDVSLSLPVMGGHSIGLKIHERPLIVPGDSWEVEEGMVMCIETVSAVEKYNEHYHLEDMVVVTRDGLDVLSDYSDISDLLPID